jgi:hypothetical protein
MIRAVGMTGRHDCWLARDVAEPMSGLFGRLGICAFKESSTSYCGLERHKSSNFFIFPAVLRDGPRLANTNGCATRCEYRGFDGMMVFSVRVWTGGLWLCSYLCSSSDGRRGRALGITQTYRTGQIQGRQNQPWSTVRLPDVVEFTLRIARRSSIVVKPPGA